MAGELVLALVLVAANGFFVAVEFSVARLRPTQAQELLREGRPGAKSVAHAVEHIDSYLSACQLGITMASLGLGALGEPAFHDLLEPILGDAATIGGFGLAAAVAFLIITTLHVVVGELAPKSLAIARTAPVVLALAPPKRAFYLSTKPLVDLFNAMGNLLLKPFGVPSASEAGHQPHSEDELRQLLRESSREGLIEREEQELSEAALVFGDMRAREVMKPRGEIDMVLTADSPRTIAERAIATGRTRLPLCEPDRGLESAVGVVNAKDLLPLIFEEAESIDVSGLARPLAHVSESARVDEVLREMRENPRRGYDPLLVKALINVTGVFPVGTCGILDNHELVVVTARNPDPKKLHQPHVKIICDELGVMLAKPITVDLSEIDPHTGRPKRAIVKTVDPDKYGIRVADYFV
jgi:CBS domain containing-hemolysin-like protein